MSGVFLAGGRLTADFFAATDFFDVDLIAVDLIADDLVAPDFIVDDFVVEAARGAVTRRVCPAMARVPFIPLSALSRATVRPLREAIDASVSPRRTTW